MNENLKNLLDAVRKDLLTMTAFTATHTGDGCNNKESEVFDAHDGALHDPDLLQECVTDARVSLLHLEDLLKGKVGQPHFSLAVPTPNGGFRLFPLKGNTKNLAMPEAMIQALELKDPKKAHVRMSFTVSQTLDIQFPDNI